MSLSKKLTTAVYTRDGWQCRHCNDRNALHPHHVIYQSHGGTDELDNLITLCGQCHMDGVHRGRLLIELIERTADNVVVKFTRLKGWRPR